MNLGTLDVGDAPTVRDLAHEHHAEVRETDDGWINVIIDGTVFKAPTETAAA